MKKRRTIVCFIGVDGSGKTTLAATLFQRLSYQGFDCAYIHYTLTLVDAIPSIFKRIVNVNAPLSQNERKEYKRSKGEKWLILIFLFTLIDTLVDYLRNIFLSRSILIYDRYYYDNVVRYFDKYPSWLVNLYVSLIPESDLVFLLDLPAEIAFSRKKEISIDFCRTQRKSYLRFAKQMNFGRLVTIDTISGINENKALIFDSVMSFLRS